MNSSGSRLAVIREFLETL